MREISVKDFILIAFGLAMSIIGFFGNRTLNAIEYNQSEQEKRITAVEQALVSHASLKELIEVKFNAVEANQNDQDKDLARLEAKIDILYEEKRKR